MTDMTTSIDIDLANEPALREIVERAQKEGKAQVLKVDGRTVAILVPKRNGLGAKSDPRRKALFRSAGSWKGLVDTDELLKTFYEGRGRQIRQESVE